MDRKRRESMSSVDTAWLRMDRPSNLMMICGVLVLHERVTLDRLRAVVDDRFLRFRRFRQRPVQTPAGSFWETASAFDIAAHVRRADVAEPFGKAALEALASRLMATPLDGGRPLWRFDLIERYEGGSAVVMRIHHCYADGIALIQVMLSMTDADRRGTRAGPAPPPPKPGDSAADDPVTTLLQPLAGTLLAAVSTGTTLIEKGLALWHDPAKAVALAGYGKALTAEIATLAFMGADSPTRFKGKPGIAKRVAWAEPLPLPEVKAIGHALGCSVNDVLLSSVAGAFGSYLARRGDHVAGVCMRAIVPVNLRPPGRAWKLGNRFGLVFVDLPLGIENPVERLYAVRASMEKLKDSFQPRLLFGILAALGAGPKGLQDQLLAMLSRNATAVMTNVPGPQQRLYLGGARIDNMMFWVPQSGDIGVGVSILSYANEVQFGLMTDRKLCRDPGRVIERFAPEFEKLVLATLLSPWPWAAPPAPGQVEQCLYPPHA